MEENTIRMYDKGHAARPDSREGVRLRVEMTMNDADDFRTFRAPENKPDAKPSWQRMRKGIADLHRRAEVSQAANNR